MSYLFLSETAKLSVAKEITDKFEYESLLSFSNSCAGLYSDYDEFTADEVMDLVRKIIKGEMVINEYRMVLFEEGQEDDEEYFFESSNENAIVKAEGIFKEHKQVYGASGYTLFLKDEVILSINDKKM